MFWPSEYIFYPFQGVNRQEDFQIKTGITVDFKGNSSFVWEIFLPIDTLKRVKMYSEGQNTF